MTRARGIRLILSDVDGTILPYGERCVSGRVISAFHAALDAGIHIGPASGRGFSYIPTAFGGDAACTVTCLATNGMQVYVDGHLIHQVTVPRDSLVQVAELLRALPHAGLICFEDGAPLLIEGDVEDLEMSFPAYARACRKVDTIPNHGIEKANVFVGGDMRYTQEVFEHLCAHVDDLDFNLPMVGFLNILPVGWSKASGIDLMCETLGIGLEDVVVFGDGGNDVEMLEHVPNSVAVAGAAPEAAAAARWHIGRCEDDAVAQVIEALVAGVWPFADERSRKGVQ